MRVRVKLRNYVDGMQFPTVIMPNQRQGWPLHVMVDTQDPEVWNFITDLRLGKVDVEARNQKLHVKYVSSVLTLRNISVDLW